MALGILKDGTLKKLFKKHSGRDQISESARERVDELVIELLEKVAKAAGDSAQKDDLTRIMPANIDAAFGEILSRSDVAPEPGRFLDALNKMDIRQLGEVLRLITDWTHQDDAGARP